MKRLLQQLKEFYCLSPISFNIFIFVFATTFYVTWPLALGNRTTPTPLSYNGETYFSQRVFLTIYVAQVLHAHCVCFGINGFDILFIQSILILTFHFTTMRNILKMLDNCMEVSEQKQKDIMVQIYKMHLDQL